MAWWFESAAHAGAWVHEPGAGYAEVRYSHQQSRSVFPGTGPAIPQTDPSLVGVLSEVFEDGRYTASDVSAYLEVGVLPFVELVGSLPYRAAANRWVFAKGDADDLVQRNHGLGDATFGLRAGGSVGRVALSGSVLGRAPLYDNSPEVLGQEVGNSDFADDRVVLGAGTNELEVGGDAGTSLGRGWIQLGAGVRFRNRGFSTMVPMRAQFGLKPIDRVAVFVGADAMVPADNGPAPDEFRGEWGSGPLAIDHQRFLALSLGGMVEVAGGVGLAAGVARTVAGSRFPRLTTLSAGVTTNFDFWPDPPEAP